MITLTDHSTTVSEIVQADYRTADVFKKYNINYCCSGRISLEEACVAKGVSMDHVLTDLDKVTRTVVVSNLINYDSWPTGFLIDYIVHVHHGFMKIALPQLEMRLMAFEDGHKKKYPELTLLLRTLTDLSAQLMLHNQHEEEVIFPYIRQIDNAFMQKEVYANLFVKTLRKPLTNIGIEHKKIDLLMQQLQQQANYFVPPEKACTNHKVVYHKMKEFYDDMVQHKYLESAVLVPRAMQIEKESLQL